MERYDSVEAFADHVSDELGGERGKYAAEIIQYVMESDTYIDRLRNVSDTYTASQLIHGLRALPDVLDHEEIEDIDDLEYGRSRGSKTWKFHRVRDALEREIDGEHSQYA